MDHSEDDVRVGLSPCGLGVFSLRRFTKHEWVGPIQGTVMDDPRYESDYCMELGSARTLEPDGPFRFVNHSCHPNCELVEVEADEAEAVCDDQAEAGSIHGELWLEVLCEIPAGQELTIDYAWPAAVAIPCRCGSADCRGWIVAAEEVGRVNHGPRSTKVSTNSARVSTSSARVS